jgi:hypothetical protein
MRRSVICPTGKLIPSLSEIFPKAWNIENPGFVKVYYNLSLVISAKVRDR